jgi:hypothetical protein
MYQPEHNPVRTISKRQLQREAVQFWKESGSEVIDAGVERDPELTIHRIQRVLSPELLKGGYQSPAESVSQGAFFGHCYAASEALFYLLGGSGSEYQPWQARHSEEVTHWWLQSEAGEQVDPTRAQFDTIGETPPYDKGAPRPFLTQYKEEPCWRAAEIVRRVVRIEEQEALALTEISPALREFRKNEITLREHDYPVDRGLVKTGKLDRQTYISISAPELEHVVQNLTARDRWMDVGPGELHAISDYYFSQEYSGKATTVALNLTPLESGIAIENLDRLNRHFGQGKFSYEIGSVMDCSKEEFGRTALITDIYAAFCYSADIGAVLEKYAELLKANGHLALVARGNSFEDEQGKHISLKQFFSNLPGFKLIGSSSRDGFLLKRTRARFQKPELELKEFKARDASKKIYFPKKKYTVKSAGKLE